VIPDLASDLARRLVADFGFREAKGWLRQGTCPNCGKRELFTKADGPWIVRCGRENKCGWEGHIRDLYPDAFARFNERYQATESDPHATADAYLRMARGLDPARMRGWYTQERYYNPNAVGQKGTATVRFWIDRAVGVYMERFVEELRLRDPESGEVKVRKAHFSGAHKGLWWAPPDLAIEPGDTVWLVEGCLDAAALAHNGIKAVATLSCVNYPDKSMAAHRDKGVTWVWALDADAAGRKWTRRHVDRMRAEGLRVAAAQPPAGKAKLDWNDLHQRGRLVNGSVEKYRYYGDLLIARSAFEKGLRMYQQTGRKEFAFEFDRRTWWFAMDVDKVTKAIAELEEQDTGLSSEEIREQALKQCGGLVELSNCHTEFLYFQANQITDESWYYCRVNFPHGARAVKATFTGSQLSGATEYKKRLLSVAPGAMWTGSSAQLDRIARDQLFGIPIVQTVDFVGYAKEHGCYVFSEVCVRDGRLYALNEEDFFEAGKLSIKTLAQSAQLHINTDPHGYSEDWVRPYWRAYGPLGMVALAWWFGSLFAEQIRERHKSWPFLEIIGEPGSGKSTVIEFLWKLVGRRDYEGFDPSKSTLAARARNFAQVSNMPVVLIEADRDEDTAKSRRFDWDELKTAYNGRSVRARGHKNSGNETYEPPFRAAVCISQNAEVDASEAILQRIIHLRFSRETHTPETKRIAEDLERWPLEKLSGFLLKAITREAQVLETIYARTPGHESALLRSPDIKSVRIAKNHAQLMACLDALTEVMALPEEAKARTLAHIEDLAIARQRAINADHPLVVDFWETYEFLNGTPENPVLNHSAEHNIIAVNLNHYARVAAEGKQQIPSIVDLKRLLKTSRRPKFIGQRVMKSAIWRGDFSGPASVRCWVFQG